MLVATTPAPPLLITVFGAPWCRRKALRRVEEED